MLFLILKAKFSDLKWMKIFGLKFSEGKKVLKFARFSMRIF